MGAIWPRLAMRRARVESDARRRVHAHDALGAPVQHLVEPRGNDRADGGTARGGARRWRRRSRRCAAGAGRRAGKGWLPAEALLVAELATIEAEEDPAAALEALEAARLVHTAALAPPLERWVLRWLAPRLRRSGLLPLLLPLLLLPLLLPLLLLLRLPLRRAAG